MVIDRKKMLSLLVAVHMVAAPLYTRMHLAVAGLAFILTIYALLFLTERVKAPTRYVRLLMVFAVLAVVVFSYGTILGQMPGTSMIVLLSFMKLFELKRFRDVATVVFLGYFITATSFFHTQSPLLALYVLLVVIYLTSILVLFSDECESLKLKQRIQLATRMVLQSIPLMLVLFILFPRVSGPLWGVPDDAYSATIGIDDEMAPGSINRLISSGAVAFRVKFDNKIPARSDLYWRGLVLSDYDGTTWRRDDAPLRARPLVSDYNDEPLRYKVTLQPHNEHWLFALEQLVAQSRLLGVSREFQLFARNPVTDVFSYRAAASVQAKNTGLFEQEQLKNLALPAGINQKSVALAQRLKQQAGNDNRQYVKRVLDYLRDQPFYYTLSPPLLGDDAMDDFLFKTRRGFCEHYASAFVYLMRAAGVPARVVIGYQGGEMNPVDDYMIVRQSDAHAWAEIWTGNNWLRVDPTQAVAPQRIERGIQNAGLERELLPSVFLIENRHLIRARYMLDSFYNSWNQWVIGFNQNKQKELFGFLGVEDLSIANLVTWLVMAMVITSGALAWWLFRHNAHRHSDRVRAYYDVFCRKFEKAGLARAPNEGPCEFAERVSNSFPVISDQAAIITSCYIHLRYGSGSSEAGTKQFIRQVKQFRVARRK